MSVAIDNGKTFTWVNKPDNTECDKVVAEVRRLVAVRFPGEIHVQNYTKDCHVLVHIQDGKIIVNITNPADKEFRLKE